MYSNARNKALNAETQRPQRKDSRKAGEGTQVRMRNGGLVMTESFDGVGVHGADGWD
jgi:hypothetical protein